MKTSHPKGVAVACALAARGHFRPDVGSHPAMTDIGPDNQEQLVIPGAERIGVGNPTRPRKRSDPPRHQWR